MERQIIDFSDPADAAWLRSQLERIAAYEEDYLPQKPRAWHPAIAGLRDRLADLVKSHDKHKRAAERREKTRGIGARTAVPEWSPFVARGERLAAPLLVSPASLDRALFFSNHVFRSASSLGIAVHLDDLSGRFGLSFETARLQFGVREELDDEWQHVLIFGQVQKRRMKRPTGRLFVAVYAPLRDSAKKHRDNPDGSFKPLGSMLFEPLFRRVVECREAARAEAVRQTRQEEVRQRWAQIEAERAEEAAAAQERQRLAELERQREAELLREAINWRDAQVIRDFVSEMSRSGSRPTEWAHWALSVADGKGQPRRDSESEEIPAWHRIAVNGMTAARMMDCGRSTFFQRVKDGIYPKPGPDGQWSVENLRAIHRG